MMDERSAAIPLDEFSDPVLAYAVEGRDGRITAVNDAFERRFDDVSPDASVSTVFDRFGSIETSGDENPLTHVVRGDRVGIYLDGDRGPFFGRVIPSDEDGGYLVFSDLGRCPDVEDPPAVDQVSSVISHDLRNPLDVAKAHLQAARETGDPEHFESVSSAHDRMERIIRDVLTLTRGDAVVDPSERVSVETAATEAWQSVETERATLDLRDSLPTTTADPDRVRRLFENLFRNSVEHSSTNNRTESGDAVEHGSTSPRSQAPEDSVEHSSTSSRADPGDSVEHGPEVGDTSARGDGTAPEDDVTITVGTLADGFYVADDGPGIPPKNGRMSSNRDTPPRMTARDLASRSSNESSLRTTGNCVSPQPNLVVCGSRSSSNIDDRTQTTTDRQSTDESGEIFEAVRDAVDDGTMTTRP